MSTRNNSIQQVSTTAPVGASVGDTWFDPSTNRQYQLLPVNGTSVQWTEVPTGANAYGAVTASPGSWTALQSFLGTSNSLGVALNNAAEKIIFVSTGATGTIDYNVTSQSILYYVGNAGSNWALNFRGSATASLNSIMAIGQSVTVVFLANQSTTAYINNSVRIDGVSYTPAWQGSAPTSGTASGTDLYSYTIVKSNEYSFVVFASRTAYTTPVFVTGLPGGAPAGLYEFTSATFSPGGTTGRDGPSLANARTGLTGAGTDAWKSNTSFFSTVAGIQYWTVPRTGSYRIEAWGAQGGTSGSQQGGRGARIQGNFTLTEGEIIRILVGQQGSTGAHTQDGQPVSAGGGGTYVIRTPYNDTGSILVIAGGGGGAAQNSWTSAQGNHAPATNNGGFGGSGSEAGGTGGNGGNSGTGCGGAGFTGNGATGSGSAAGDMAKSFVNGGQGGGNARSWGGTEIYGGFGGGGGGGGLAAGGGGGYSGGGAGTWSSPQQGGGGGSYNSGTSPVNETGNTGSATLTGAGKVTITSLDSVTTSSALYEFGGPATFTPGGVTGISGPTLTQARTGLTGTGVDAWKTDTNYFNVTSGIQYWTVPQTGSYRIEAWGAQGGSPSGSYPNGGFGARMRGDFDLTGGEIIRILVGQTGSNAYGGGGGGTFVIKSPYTTTQSILVIAGGGNATSPWSSTLSHGTTASTGQTSSAYSGGSAGAGGNSNAGVYGGAGFTGNPPGSDSCSATRPQSFTNGGAGGSGASNGKGGFGGGSATDDQCYGASGAGGGYSGGGGTSSSSQYGGGGGSYNNGTNPSNDNGSQGTATQSGNGKVIITKL
jgi:hypothetical protein